MNQLHSLKLFALLLILKSTILLPTPTAVAETPNDDEMIPRGVVERLLRLNIPDFMGVEKELLIGKLPGNLPVEIPQPTNTQIIGTIQRGKDNYQIELDIPQPATQVESFYQSQLTSKGWKQQKQPSPQQAFATTANQSNQNIGYCKSEKGPSINLSISQSEKTSTAVSIGLSTDKNNYFCRYLSGGSPFDIVEVPSLKPPENTKVIPNPMRTFSSEMSNSIATLESQLNLEQLNQHYINQMQQAGWTKTADAKDAQINLSTWTLKSKEDVTWEGIMRIKPVEGKSGQYSANLMILPDKM
ncbi:MAG: hypothetical protein HC907_15765 [Richelia sp. SM1_7_0]|nr:hypothetical protein [Richelia sp. SM1_7_0]